MSLLSNIKQSLLLARKAKSEDVDTLRTLLGDVEKIGKDDGNRETTDKEVIQVVRKAIKNNTGTIGSMLEKSGGVLSGKYRSTEELLRKQNTLFKSFLPIELDDDELFKVITKFIDERDDCSMGEVMTHLSTKYTGRYDGRAASKMVREELS